MAYGFRGFIGIGKESSWGTPVSVTDYFEALSENLTAGLGRFDTKNIVGTVAEPDDDTGTTRYTGSIMAPMMPQALGYYLKGIMQTASGSVITSGYLWKNDFTTSLADFSTDTPVQPYTIEVYRDVTSSVLYAGCVFDQLELSFTPNQALSMNTSIIGKVASMSAPSSTTPSYPGSPTKPFNFTTMSLSVGGSATARVEQLKLTINNQLEGISSLNASDYIAKIRRKGPQTIGLAGTIDFTDMTEYQDFINQTERRWFWNITQAASFQLFVDIPRMVYTAFPLGQPGRGRLTVGFTGKAFYSAGSATAIKMSLTNVKSFY